MKTPTDPAAAVAALNAMLAAATVAADLWEALDAVGEEGEPLAAAAFHLHSQIWSTIGARAIESRAARPRQSPPLRLTVRAGESEAAR